MAFMIGAMDMCIKDNSLMTFETDKGSYIYKISLSIKVFG